MALSRRFRGELKRELRRIKESRRSIRGASVGDVVTSKGGGVGLMWPTRNADPIGPRGRET